MTVKRQLLSYGKGSTDFRMGQGAFSELSGLLAANVLRPHRAILIFPSSFAGADDASSSLTEVRRALVDAGFEVIEHAVGDSSPVPDAAALFSFLSAASLHRMTADDLFVAFGSLGICSMAALAARLWHGGSPCALLPSDADAMARCTTEMLAVPIEAGGAGALKLAPHASMVVCELGLLEGESLRSDATRAGFATMLCAHLASNRTHLDHFAELIPLLREGDAPSIQDALARTQSSRLSSLKSVSPSARRALDFGRVTARALSSLVDALSFAECYAEGVRFEARLAHDVFGFDAEDVFKLDDALYDLGIEEPSYELDPDAFVAAIEDAVRSSSLRFQLPLPKSPGVIRLSSVDSDLLLRHARAFCESRRP